MAKKAKQKSKFPKQYGYKSSATRAITNYENKHGKKENEQFVINQLDENCFEVELLNLKK